MSQPANNKSWVNTVWNGAYFIAEPIQKIARKGWSYAPLNAKNYAEETWSEFDPETRSTIKKGAALAVSALATAAAGYGMKMLGEYSGNKLSNGCESYLASEETCNAAEEWMQTGATAIGGLAAGTVTTAYRWLKGDSKTESVASGCAATALYWSGAPAATAGLVTGVVRTASRLYNGDSLKDSLIEGTRLAAAAAGSSVLSNNSIALAATAGAIPGLLTGGAVLMAANPGVSTLVQIPRGPLFRGDNPDGEQPIPDDPSLALQMLTGKVCEFRSTLPPGLSWIDPDEILIKRMSSQVLEAIQLGLKRPRVDDSDEAKAAIVSAVLRRWDPSITAAAVTISLVEKIEAIPVLSDVYVDAKKETDKQLDLLVKNSSMFTTLYYIHCNRLGIEQTDAVNTSFKEILKDLNEAEDPSLSLWDVYMMRMGHDLGFFQKLRARFWYFLSYTIGIIPNTMNSFVINVIGEFRKSVESSNPDKLNSVFKKGLDQLTLLLEIYNGAARKYANAEDPIGTLALYQKLAIDKLGDDLLFRRVEANLKPGEDIGKKMMSELCKELTDNLVNQCFPRVRFFENLKDTAVLGIRIGIVFDLLDWVFGGIINFFARELTRFYLPGIVQSLVEIGLDKTLPGQYSFKIAIANSLSSQVETLHEEMANPVTTKPPHLVDSTFIDGAAERLMMTLKLRLLGENPTQEQVKDFLSKLDSRREVPDNEKELRAQLIKGAKIFIYYYSQKPEKMETLFGDLLRFSNNGFEVNHANESEADYEIAITRLKNACKGLISEAVRDEIKDQLKGPNPKKIKEFMEGRPGMLGIYDVQKNKGKKSFQTLSKSCKEMRRVLDARNHNEGILLLKELDHYAETLKEFAAHAAKIEIEIYPVDVQHGFYKAFHSIYQDSVPLAQKAIDIQGPKIQYDKNLKLAHKFKELNTMIDRGFHDPIKLREKLDLIEKIGASYNSQVPGLVVHLEKLRELVKGIESAEQSAKHENDIIRGLEILGPVEQFTYNLSSNPKEWIERIRRAIPAEDQPILFQKIGLLQAAIRQVRRPDLRVLRANVKDELESIFRRHKTLKYEKTDLLNSKLAEFKADTTEALKQSEHARDEGLKTIRGELEILGTQTDELLEKLELVEMQNLYLPFKDAPNHLIEAVYEREGKPIVESFQPYLGAAFDLITHNDIYQGSARLMMGSINRSYPEKSSSIASSIFQWIGRKTFPSPVGGDE